MSVKKQKPNVIGRYRPLLSQRSANKVWEVFFRLRHIVFTQDQFYILYYYIKSSSIHNTWALEMATRFNLPGIATELIPHFKSLTNEKKTSVVQYMCKTDRVKILRIFAPHYKFNLVQVTRWMSNSSSEFEIFKFLLEETGLLPELVNSLSYNVCFFGMVWVRSDINISSSTVCNYMCIIVSDADQTIELLQYHGITENEN